MTTAQVVLDEKGSEVTSIDRNTMVGEATEMMAEQGIGALVVTDGGKAVGIFTERDVVNRVVAARRDPNATMVGEVMTVQVACWRRDTLLTECEAVMADRSIRHLPVVENGRLYGLISSRDLMANEVAEAHDTIDYLEGTIDDMNAYMYTKT